MTNALSSDLQERETHKKILHFLYCMAWVHAGPAQVLCGEAIRSADSARIPQCSFYLMLRGSRQRSLESDVAELCDAGPRGSTHVLEEARERVRV